MVQNLHEELTFAVTEVQGRNVTKLRSTSQYNCHWYKGPKVTLNDLLTVGGGSRELDTGVQQLPQTPQVKHWKIRISSKIILYFSNICPTPILKAKEILPGTNLDLSLTWWLCYRYTIELSRLKLGMGPLDKKTGALMKQSNKWPYHFRFHKNLFESESAAVWGKASWGRPVDIQNLKPTLLFGNPRTPAKLEWYPWGSLKIRIILKS